MKRNLPLIAFPLTFVALAVTGCTQVSGTDTDGQLIQPSKNVEWDYSPVKPFYSIPLNASDITVNCGNEDMSLKEIYLVKTYPRMDSSWPSELPSEQVQYVKSTGSGITSLKNIVSEDAKGSSEFCPALRLAGQVEEDFSRSVSGPSFSVDRSQSQLNLVPGIQKEMFIDTTSDDYNIGGYRKATATLRHVAEHCLVWTVSWDKTVIQEDGTQSVEKQDFWTDGVAQGKLVNHITAENLARAFEAVYGRTRELAGEESDQMFYSYSNGEWTKKDMDLLSDTGKKVNLVIYDIGDDAGSFNGVIGYFNAKDYYPSPEDLRANSAAQYQEDDLAFFSNEGKYIYLDAFHVNNNWQQTVSTLSHEFAHMVNFNNKRMKHGLKMSEWMDEMLSMLVEDAMQNLVDITSEVIIRIGRDAGPESRLPLFCAGYKDYGLGAETWSASLVNLEYSWSYAFGAFLLRNFGGLPLLKEMCRNNLKDIGCITEAVSLVYGKTVNLDILFRDFAFACVFDAKLPSFNAPTFNFQTVMNSIDLWDLAQEIPETFARVQAGSNKDKYSFAGPVYYSGNDRYRLPQNGIFISRVGLVKEGVKSGTLMLDLGKEEISPYQRLYLIIK